MFRPPMPLQGILFDNQPQRGRCFLCYPADSEISNHLCAYNGAPFMATKQVSGHDFSVLPVASVASKGSAVAPKNS